MFKFLKILTLSACLFSVGGFAEITDESTGEIFPSEVIFKNGGKDYHLQATGVATRKKLIVKVYSIASYLEDPATAVGADKFQVFTTDGKAKQLSMKWVHDVDVTRIQDAYKEGI